MTGPLYVNADIFAGDGIVVGTGDANPAAAGQIRLSNNPTISFDRNGVPEWTIRQNSSALRIGDSVNNRDQFLLASGVDSTAALTTMNSRLTVQGNVIANADLTVTTDAKVAGKSLPRGCIKNSSNWNQNTSASTKLYVQPINVDFVSGRRYLISLYYSIGSTATVLADVFTVGLEVNAIDVGNVPLYIDVAAQALPSGVLPVIYVAASTGPLQVRAYAQRTTGTGVLTYKGLWLVEDIGV
jgi:hypothetical protein